MKKSLLTALLPAAVASLATGCVIIEDTPESTITATWTLVAGDNNDPVACPPGATTIALVAQDSFGERTVDLFDCERGAGTTASILPDAYSVWLQLTDETGELLYAQSLSEVVFLSDGANAQVGFTFSIDRGSFTVDWNVYEAGLPSDCDAVGATGFSLTFTDPDGGFYDEDVLPCSAYEGSTRGLPVGVPWLMSPALVNQEGAIAVADPLEGELDYGNQYKDMGLVVFDPTVP